ncbi:MAG: hypothetical protein WB780_21235 [Candidatus Acidiferrales bacterium]
MKSTPEIQLLERLAVVELPFGADREQSDGYQGVKITMSNLQNKGETEAKDELLPGLSDLFAKAVTEQETERADREIKKTVSEALPTMLPQLVQEAGDSIFNFVTRIFDAPVSHRANSTKRRDFQILSRAACELSTSGGNEAAFDALHRGLVRAEGALDRGDEERFRARVRLALDKAFKTGWTGEDFLALDQEIKKQERRMELHRTIRRLIGSKGLRRIRKSRQRRVSRQCEMSPADEKFYT